MKFHSEAYPSGARETSGDKDVPDPYVRPTPEDPPRVLHGPDSFPVPVERVGGPGHDPTPTAAGDGGAPPEDWGEEEVHLDHTVPFCL